MVAKEESVDETPELPEGEARSLERLVGPLRPKNRDKWVRGYACAVAVLVKNYPEPPIVDCLIRNGPTRDEILKHADEEDIETLQEAGYLRPNIRGDTPRAKPEGCV